MKIVLFLLLAVPVVCLGFNFVSFYSVKNVQHQHIVISGVKSKPEESKSYSNHSTIVKPKQANLKQTNNIAVICVTTGILVFAASKFLVTAVSILQIIVALGSIKLLNDYITSSTSGTKETPPSAALDNTVNPPSIANSTSRDAYVRNLQGLQNTLTQLQESIDEKQRLLLEIESKISSTKSLSAEKDVTESN